MAYDGSKLRWRNQRVHTPNVVFGEVVYLPGGTCGPRIQRDFELLAVHSGACQITLNGRTVELTAGHVCQFRPGGREFFRFAEDRETHHSWCSIKPAYLPNGVAGQLAKAAFAVPWSDFFGSLYATIAKLQPPRNDAAAALIDQLGLCFFTGFIAASAEMHDSAQPEPAVRLFLNYLESHFGDHDCLRAGHRASGLSRNALIYKFHRAMKLTPARYLWRLRVERGVAMLNETGLTIAEIAYRCGFKDPFHFSKLVKKHIGHPPKVIRRGGQ